MSRVVHKYPVPLGRFVTPLPRGAEFLHVEAQAGIPQMWYLVDLAETDTEQRTFVVLGTGHLLPDGPPLAHRGTFQLDGGTFVGHLFEVVT